MGFELLPDARAQLNRTRMTVEKGLAGHWVVRFSDRIIFGMLAVALLSPINTDQRIPDGYNLTYGSTSEDVRVRLDNDWWGRAEDFATLTAMDRKNFRLKLDFSNVMPSTAPGQSRRANRSPQRRRQRRSGTAPSQPAGQV